jgi:uncharacterized protein
MAATRLDRSEIQVIDSDTHVTESPDLWTSRLPARWREMAPQVDTDPVSGLEKWRVGDVWLGPVGQFTHAGWHEFFPGCPPTLEEADPGAWNPKARLERMDEYGIHAQVLYPNIMGFDTWVFMHHQDQEFALGCVSAYNDFQTEFAAADPGRLVPITVVPYWNLDAAAKEIKRCAAMGHRGLLWANKFEQVGLPGFTDSHWDPIYTLAQELGQSINFHVGFAREDGNTTPEIFTEKTAGTRENPPDGPVVITRLRAAVPLLMSNGDTITALLLSDLPQRCPDLKFVSVESGFGYVPYLLEAIDWQYCQFGARDAFRDRLMPSEYFRRQCYGTFWFEKGTLKLLEDYPDNFMYETDFPHPTSMSPGHGSYAKNPKEVQDDIINMLPADLARKVLQDNATAVYRLG